MESIYSDPIQVSDVRESVANAPSITGSVFPGGTLSVDVRNTSVQWQVQRGADWFDIPGATGSFTLTQANAGQQIRALVSYLSTDEDNPGATAIVATAAQAVGGATTGTGAAPVAVDNYDIEISVDAPGHGMGNNAGHNLSHTEMVPLASLFQDPDSARLSFTVATVSGLSTAPTNSGTGTDSVTGTYVYDDIPGGVLVLEANTGKFIFHSDVYQTHDGSDGDGLGNVITLNLRASDGVNTSSSTDTAAINLRINVAPTGINFNSEPDGNGSENGTAATPIAIDEHVGSEAAGSLGMFIARVDVQDQNSDTHSFGTHDVMISGDDRFMITNTGNGRTDGNEGDGSPDGSTWEVRLKPGVMLDYETQDGHESAGGRQADRAYGHGYRWRWPEHAGGSGSNADHAYHFAR